MVFVLLQYFIPLFVLSLSSFSNSPPPIPSLIYLNCTPPSQNGVVNYSFIYFPSYVGTTSYWSCSNQTIIMDRVQFEAAFETLLLRLRADMVNAVSQLRFSSTGEVQYGNSSQVLYGLSDCVRNVSHKDCEVCVEKGTEKLLECCGGKAGGTVVAGNCIVRYETYKFFSRVCSGGGLDASNGPSVAVNVRVDNENGGGKGFQEKVAVVWGVGSGCLVVVVFCAWLLRRSIINKAKVGISGSKEADDDAGPGS